MAQFCTITALNASLAAVLIPLRILTMRPRAKTPDTTEREPGSALPLAGEAPSASRYTCLSPKS